MKLMVGDYVRQSLMDNDKVNWVVKIKNIRIIEDNNLKVWNGTIYDCEVVRGETKYKGLTTGITFSLYDSYFFKYKCKKLTKEEIRMELI